MPVAFWMLRLAIRLLGLVSPALAGRWVYRLWFQPLRYPEPPQEKEWCRTAQPLAVVHRGLRLAVDSWGAGPTVLMVHGWNGRREIGVTSEGLFFRQSFITRSDHSFR